MPPRNARRDFLKQSTLAGFGYWVAGSTVKAEEGKSANDRIRIACIGVGGKGSSDSDHAGEIGDVVAICDCDDKPLSKKAEKYPKAKKFNDYRKMLDEMASGIDAVTVSTADHSHAPASLMAMRLGKHVYCQKPMTHSVYEARLMRETAAKMKVATQMGNQGTASDGLRRGVEIIQAGVLGPVREVHVWTNRPIWPQGGEAVLRTTAGSAAAFAALHGKTLKELPKVDVPPNVHWDLFLGTAPERPYDPAYHPWTWRGWWDFGTGALGDMGCHTMNLAFMALKLGAPKSIDAKSAEINPETCPTWAVVTYQFPKRGDLAPMKFTWYEGQEKGRKKLPPEKLFHGEKPVDSGLLFVGEKGIMYSPNDYGGDQKFLGDNAAELASAAAAVPVSLPRNGEHDLGMKKEWAAAIRGGPAAMSNFDYSGPLTEMVLLGNVAIRTGKKIDWDAENLKAVGCPEADQYIKPEIRKGWTL
ncbi:MAG TPA: Gfo/Idh/MocA family oxidoreductase [Pirellulales bacterium]|jgi:predicted dehydrogenase|nr:Gfo/Idh/MocA family oxidoreductase [Pirellulales bacterium]